MKRQTHTDTELVLAALENPNEYKAIMDLYSARLTRFVLRIGASSQAEAEDIIQEVFITAWKYLKGYDANYSFSGWIYRIARQKTIAHHRWFLRKGNTSEISEEIPDLAMHTDELPLEVENRVLWQAIQGLPTNEREVILLRYEEELDYDTIADIIRKPAGTVATLLHRGKKRLKEHLDRSIPPTTHE